MNTTNNKYYENYDASNYASLFTGKVENAIIPQEILVKLAKDLGFSYELYLTLASISLEAANNLVTSMSDITKISNIALLIDSEEGAAVGYSLESPRIPVLNSEFIKRVESMVSADSEVELAEESYHTKEMSSSVLIRKVSPIVVEELHHDDVAIGIPYKVGILLINDELNTTYCRLVVYVKGQPYYLPASYYNVTTARYKRSTENSIGALEVLILKVLDDLRDTALQEKIVDFHRKYKYNSTIKSSYEEYNTLLRIMSKIPTIIEEHSFLDSLALKYTDFEERYAHLEDQKSSYIWRCTAMSDLTIGHLVEITTNILNELAAPVDEYFYVRDLIGSYMCTNRILAEIAQEDMT